MVFITEDLIRKRAEHNNCEITTLEELSLHQCDIERIEHIDKWCRDLKILYLQSNLIPKFENLSRLKKLEYLNLALNNIQHIENLEGCESLTKLDLTVNFVARATSVENLRVNQFLVELFLTGNPCTDYVGYRDYVIAALPQLKQLDGTEITRTERITAMQSFSTLRCDMLRQEKVYIEKMEREKAEEKACKENEGKPGYKKDWYTNTDAAHIENDEEKEKGNSCSDDKTKADDDFWHKPTKYTPEARLETHRYMEEKRKEKDEYKSSFPDLTPPKRQIRFFNDEGRPMNINQANIGFTLTENEEEEEYVLDVACYKYLDTSLIDVDIQPQFARVTIKEKVFQLVLNEEISPDASTAHRSQTTGHLVLTLPKMKSVLSANKKKEKSTKDTKCEKTNPSHENKKGQQTSTQLKEEKLEVGSGDEGKNKIDIYNIVRENNTCEKTLNSVLFSSKKKTNSLKNEKCIEAETEFVDDLDVPPLE